MQKTAVFFCFLTGLDFQLFESEMRCALIEQEVREEITRDMEERMRAMEKRHAKRLQDEVCVRFAISSTM